MLETAVNWARAVRTDVIALYIAGRDPRTPLAAKLVALCIVAYALSPIDLIPDFIPVLGYLDDLVIVPLGIIFAVRLIPSALMAEFRHAASECHPLPSQRIAAAFILTIWILCAGAVTWWAVHRFG